MGDGKIGIALTKQNGIYEQTASGITFSVAEAST
jgi:hypothetical protein